MVDYAVTMRRIILVYLLCIPPLLAAESGYRIVHPDGSVEYTDQPVKGGEPINLPQIPTYSTPPSTTKGGVTTPSDKIQQEKKVTRSISISSPGPEETVWFSEAGMTVSVQVSPPLGEGEQVLIRLDGSAVARGDSSSFTLKDVYRGTHVLSAAVTDGSGTVLSESSPITFYMRQHTAK
jgi:hypothetical protein